MSSFIPLSLRILTKKFSQGFLGSCAPLLLSHGNYTTTELSMLEDAARIEVMGGKVPIYVRFMVVTAVKE